MSEAKIITTEHGERYAAIPLEDYERITKTLEHVLDELEMLKAEQVLARVESGEEEPIPADVVGRVIVEGVAPLKAIREWRDLTQEELAEKAGTSKSYISQVETGYRDPGRKLLLKLARVLRVPVDVLMN